MVPDVPVLDKNDRKSPVTIRTAIDKPKITIGDKVVYNVTVSHDRKYDVRITDLAETLGQFEIKDYKISKPAKKGRNLVREYRYVITTFTTGEFSIEPFFVEWEDAEGNYRKARSAAIAVFVEGVKASATDKDDIRDIKNPVSMPRPPLFYILLFGIPLASVLGAAYYYFFVKNRGNAGFFLQEEKNKKPDELAYERLEKLNSMGLVEKGDIKEYYIILSEIIRRYLELRYGIAVLDMTTHELYQELRRINLDKKHMFLIKDFMDECDMVKFAKYRPEVKITAQDFNSAKNIVGVTREEAPVTAGALSGEKAGEKA